ncbi:MAG: autotransporter-associated beta strand repeat-containing protein [Akkermansia sp.]|nr:autotransporter-associated beta strand repeat-containing protein [Akkermansia sp.]
MSLARITDVKFHVQPQPVHRGWLRYFVAAVSMGIGVAEAQEMRMLDYWWVMPEEQQENAPRVIRVTGEKGEKFEEVYAEEQLGALRNSPVIMQARLERQAALRREAVSLARQMLAEDEALQPATAYAEAWTRVFSRRWLTAKGGEGSSRLEDMLLRMASENDALVLSEEDRQWVLEALIEDDDRLDSAEGRRLLETLARNLRQSGYGRFDAAAGVNDELMARFTDALRHEHDSMAAYRDAMFKTHRGRIMQHSLVGYHAPWGMGMGGGRAVYRQAPQKVGTTVASGHVASPQTQTLVAPQSPTATLQPDFTAGMNSSAGAVENFLADAPSQAADKEEDEEEDKDKEETGEDTDAGIAAAAPSMMMRSFAMRAVAAAAQNEGGAGTSGTPDSPVQDGGVQLAPGESIDVGANRVTGGTSGGSLENVQMLVTGELMRPVTGDSVTVHNLITSADGTNPGILTDVTLHAGTATEYASLHNIAFAGKSTLTGFVTFEKTQATGDMSVAAGGTLTLKNLTFDLRGVSMGEKTLFVIEDGGTLEDRGTLEGWNADNVHFVYSGVKVNSAAVVFSEDAGKIGKIELSANHNGNLYWNGAADGMWNIGSVNWSSSEEKTVPDTFTALSNVYFGGGNAANREITVTQDMVVAKLGVTDGGYSFSGARVAVLGDASLNPGNGAVTFNDQLVVQGGLQAEGSGSVELLGGATVVKDAVFENLSTTIGGDMTVGGKLTISSGDATTAGSLTIAGNVTAQEMEFAVSAGAASDSNPDYHKHLVNVSGNLTARDNGSITIGGTAAQYYTGTVTAGNLTVNTKEHDVYFSYLQVGKLTVEEGSTVHVRSSSDAVHVSSSVFPEVDLYGTLALDAPGVTYNDSHTVNVKSDAARLVFGTGSTISDLQIVGMVDASGTSAYTDLLIEAMSRSATVTEMRDLGTLKVETGTLTVNNAGGAVHGELFLNNGKLQLGENTNDIMAAGSGAVRLENGGILDIGKSSQTLSANNQVFLSGASTITSEADGGLSLGDGIIINYEDSGNSIETKLTAEEVFTLNSTLAGSSLEISGHISGSGEMKLTGPGSVVLSSANTDFTGTVTVQKDSTLTLQNTDALLNADVVLNAGATLVLDAPDAVTLKTLTFSNGSTLDISSIVATEDFSDLYTVLNVDKNAVTFGSPGEKVELNLIFSEKLDTRKTYNLMTGVSSIDNLSFNIQHNGAALDASQYKIGHDSTTGLLYITTMMGNVWDGEGNKIWSATGGFDNWSGEKYNEDKNLGYTAAVFRDLSQKEEEVKVQGTVNPGDIYFTADATKYTLGSDGTNGHLAAGTHVHKLGKADVTLSMAGNTTADTALGSVEVQAGSLILGNDLAVKGTVTVEKDANLKLKDGSGGLNMVAEKDDEAFITYSVSTIGGDASLSGVTMDAAGITGVDKEIIATNLLVQGNAYLSNLTLKNFEAKSNEKGNVTLSNVILTSSSSSTATTLTDVTIGSGVEVYASGSYILSGNLTFDSALTNKGTVTLANVTNIEIGKITPTEDAGRYEYTFINGGTYQFIGSSSGEKITSDMVSINGVKLSDGLATGITAVFTDNKNGSFTLSFTGDTVGIPQWDERWGKPENSPALSRIYAGTAADAYVELAAGTEGNTNYYRYSSIVDGANAAKVNNGKAIVVTLSEGATGNYAVGGLVKADRVTGDVFEGWHYVHNVEVWIDDRSSIKNIIGGLDNALNNEWGRWTSAAQSGATHVLVEDPDYQKRDSIPNDYRAWDKSFVIAGSRWCDQTAESFVTVLDGEIYTIFGGSCGGYYLVDPGESWYPYCASNQTGTSHVFIDGGRIGEIFAAGMYSTLTGTQMVEGHENKRAVEMVITGGVLGGTDLRVFGGTDHGVVEGDIYIRMEGSAEIKSRLVGGSNAGSVNGDIVLDLISGRAYRVDAAGLGWYLETEYPNGYVDIYDDPASIKGDVLVNLYKDFELGIGADVNLTNGIYGGREQSNHIILLKGDDGTVHTSTLHFAEGEKYEKLAFIADNGYDTSDNSIIVTGFDRFELENKAHVVLGLGLFDVDMDPSKELVISGKGVVEVIGHGVEDLVLWDNYGKVIKSGESRNLGRNIRLEGSSTLMISTSVIGAAGSEDDRTITVTDGTTIDFSGVPGETGYTGDSDFAGLGFNVVIEGHGVEGKGAIYKGKNDDSWYPDAETFSTRSQRIILPNVELTSSASVKVVAGETLLMNNASELDGGAYAQGTAHLTLNGHTFTKLGAGDFIARSVEITPGTILVQQGGFGFDLTDDASQTDMVLAAGGELKLNASGLTTGGATNLALRSLSGAGAVKLNGSTLTLHTEADSPYYYGEYMTDEYRNDAQDYDQFSETTGFGYAVFSGMISDAKGGGKLVKTGTGVHYISGSSSTYTGGTQLQEGRLYLLGTSEASTFTKDTSKAAAGVAGTGTIEWVSANAELYLGHGARIYNKGTTDAQGGFMTIGVEGVPNAVLEDFVVKQSGGGITVTMGGVEYVEIDTHNLKSIDVAAVYADGTAYAAGTDIDRNKMLLVKLSDWATAKDSPVSGFSATGYNEAAYSGILADYSSSVAAGLHKVGVGTLELDQRNSYTGGTLVEAGTLRLRGWGTVGSGEVQVGEGASLMLAYNGGYDVDKTTTKDDETIRLSNNMTLSGAGDAQWKIQLEEDESQAASGATHSATDGLTAALISTVGRSVTFTLSGNIDGDGGVLHSGEGTLVLCGDSSYTGGTVITRGVVDVQSAFGLGATAEGMSAVKLGKDADLHVTVEPGSGGGRLVTTLATVEDEILGDVSIVGSKYTERVLHMADSGYNAATTTLGEKGTFLLCGEPIDGQGISSHSSLLTGSGTVVVSDALGSGTTAAFDTIRDYIGDFRVEGHKSSIHVDNGSYSEGSIQVAGQQASVQIGGNVSIVAGESLQLRSMGKVPTQTESVDMGTGSVLVSKGEVSVAADAVLSVRRGETIYSYNLSDLEKTVSVTPTEIALPEYTGEISASDYHKLGEDIPDYTGRFDTDLAVNQQAVAGVKADVGLTLAGGCTYETSRGHLSLIGGLIKARYSGE